MKLVRMDGDRIGLLVLLPEGPYAIDIANSLGVFSHDPLSNGLLNGALKEGHDWSMIVKHWVHLRWPLKKLQNIAVANPDTPRLVLQPLVDATGTASAANPIVAIEVTDIESVEQHDPTGWHAMHRQFAIRSGRQRRSIQANHLDQQGSRGTMSLASFNAIAAARGDGLNPKLCELLERAAVSPHSEVMVRSDGMLQAGPNPGSRDVERVSAVVVELSAAPSLRSVLS